MNAKRSNEIATSAEGSNEFERMDLMSAVSGISKSDDLLFDNTDAARSDTLDCIDMEDIGSEASKSGVQDLFNGSPKSLILLEASEFEDLTASSAVGLPDGNGSVCSRSAVSSQDSRPMSTPSELRLQLDKMQMEEIEKKMAAKMKHAEEIARIKQRLDSDRKKKGLQVIPGSRDSRKRIKEFLKEEETMAMSSEQEDLKAETKDMLSEIRAKYNIPCRREVVPDVVTMAKDFYSSKETPNDQLPEHIRRNLTSEEIRDLKLVFDMFDVKGRGFIISFDLKRAAGWLGFKAKRHVFKEMIDELATDQKGKVTFVNFLDFIVRFQGEGPDPFEEIMQGFRMMDTSEKGFLSADDLRRTADNAGLQLSNRAIREMLQEADTTGDGRITPAEFVRIMKETNTFRLTKGKTRLT